MDGFPLAAKYGYGFRGRAGGHRRAERGGRRICERGRRPGERGAYAERDGADPRAERCGRRLARVFPGRPDVPGGGGFSFAGRGRAGARRAGRAAFLARLRLGIPGTDALRNARIRRGVDPLAACFAVCGGQQPPQHRFRRDESRACLRDRYAGTARNRERVCRRIRGKDAFPARNQPRGAGGVFCQGTRLCAERGGFAHAEGEHDLRRGRYDAHGEAFGLHPDERTNGRAFVYVFLRRFQHADDAQIQPAL